MAPTDRTSRCLERSPQGKIRFAFCLSITAGACMLTPYHNQELPSRSSSLSFSFYPTTPDTPITLECAPGLIGDPYTLVFTIQSSDEPWDYQGDTLYPTSTSRILPDSCWRMVHGRYATRLRPKQNGSSMMVYDQDGHNCLGQRLGEGEGPVSAGYECALTYFESSTRSEHIVVHALP